MISTYYTCHTWTKEVTPRLLVCTNDGDILLCNSTGEFNTRIHSSPFGKRIDCIISYGEGIIVAGEDGHIWPYKVSYESGVFFEPQ